MFPSRLIELMAQERIRDLQDAAETRRRPVVEAFDRRADQIARPGRRHLRSA